MRARTTLLVFWLTAVPTLCIAQHTHQFEISGFGSYTRYDRAFSLAKQIGGAGGSATFQSHRRHRVRNGLSAADTYAGGTNATATLASGSLVLNAGGQHNLFYILGGYTRLESASGRATASPITPCTARWGPAVFWRASRPAA